MFWVGIFSCVSAQEPVDTTEVLPVNLLYFNVEETDKGIYMDWETAEEVNSNFFTVQQSQNGQTYEDAFTVKSTGSGSYYETVYLFPSPGLNYFRLVHFDTDGSKQIYPVKVVNYSGKFTVYDLQGHFLGDFSNTAMLPRNLPLVINGRIITFF